MQSFPKIRHEFNGAMERRSTKNRTKFGELWEDVMESLSKRPYHNMERVEEAIVAIGPTKLFLSDSTILALVMQNVMFNPSDVGSKRKSAANAEESLIKAFGWDAICARNVGTLIFS